LEAVLFDGRLLRPAWTPRWRKIWHGHQCIVLMAVADTAGIKQWTKFGALLFSSAVKSFERRMSNVELTLPDLGRTLGKTASKKEYRL
jgi:hypothetical protein